MDGVIAPDAATLLSVQHEVTRLQRLVGDREQLSRAEAGQIPLHREAVEPTGLIRAAASRSQPQFDDKGVESSVERMDSLPPPSTWSRPTAGRSGPRVLGQAGAARLRAPFLSLPDSAASPPLFFTQLSHSRQMLVMGAVYTSGVS